MAKEDFYPVYIDSRYRQDYLRLKQLASRRGENVAFLVSKGILLCLLDLEDKNAIANSIKNENIYE